MVQDKLPSHFPIAEGTFHGPFIPAKYDQDPTAQWLWNSEQVIQDPELYQLKRLQEQLESDRADDVIIDDDIYERNKERLARDVDARWLEINKDRLRYPPKRQ